MKEKTKERERERERRRRKVSISFLAPKEGAAHPVRLLPVLQTPPHSSQERRRRRKRKYRKPKTQKDSPSSSLFVQSTSVCFFVSFLFGSDLLPTFSFGLLNCVLFGSSPFDDSSWRLHEILAPNNITIIYYRLFGFPSKQKRKN